MKTVSNLINELHKVIGSGLRVNAAKFLANPAITKAVLDGHANNGDTALIAAVKSGNRYMVTLLLIAGANINVKNKNGKSALEIAVQQSNRQSSLQSADLEIVRILLESGVDQESRRAALNSLSGTNERSLLLSALLNRSPDSLREQAVNDANSLTQDTSARELDMRLLNACHTRNERQIAQLLQMGADPNRYRSQVGNAFGQYPLNRALDNKCKIEIVRQLLSMGAYVNDSPARRTSPPLFKAILSSRLDVIEALIQYGADVNAVDEHGMTVLHYAFANGNRETVYLIYLLIKHKATLATLEIDVNAPIPDGRTAVMMLAMNKDMREKELIKNFISLPRIDLTLADKSGNTVLHHAVMNNNSIMTEVLCSVNRGSNAIAHYINRKNIAGDTAFSIANQTPSTNKNIISMLITCSLPLIADHSQKDAPVDTQKPETPTPVEPSFGAVNKQDQDVEALKQQHQEDEPVDALKPEIPTQVEPPLVAVNKQDQDVEALKQQHQAEMAALRAQNDSAHQDKDRIISALEAEVAALKAALMQEQIKAAGLETQRTMAMTVLTGTVMFSAPRSVPNAGDVPGGISSRPQ